MRILILFTFLLGEVHSQPLNFTRFDKTLSIVSNIFGQLNDTALTTLFDEEASRIGISAQEHVDVCADRIANYWSMRAELLSLTDDEITAIGKILNHTDHELDIIEKAVMERADEYGLEQDWSMFDEHLWNISILTVFEIVRIYLLEHDSSMSFGKYDPVDAYVKQLESILESVFAILTAEDKINLDKFFCYDIIFRNISYENGTTFDLYEKFSNGFREKISFNFTRLIEELERFHPIFRHLDHSKLEDILIKDAKLFNVPSREHLETCADCASGYWEILRELENISEGGRRDIARILNKTERTIEDLASVLPVTVGFVMPKITEMKKMSAANGTIEFVNKAVFLLLRRVVVVHKSVKKTKTNMPWIIALKQEYYKIDYEGYVIFNRLFCFNFLKRKIVEHVIDDSYIGDNLLDKDFAPDTF